MRKTLDDLRNLKFPMHYIGVRLLAILLLQYDFEKLDYYYSKIGKNVGRTRQAVQRDIQNAYSIARNSNSKLPKTVSEFIKLYALGGFDYVS